MDVHIVKFQIHVTDDDVHAPFENCIWQNEWVNRWRSPHLPSLNRFFSLDQRVACSFAGDYDVVTIRFVPTDMVEMEMAVHDRESIDAHPFQIAPHPLRLLDGGKGVVDEGMAAAMDDISCNTQIHGSVFDPSARLVRLRRRRLGTAVIECS